MREQSINVAKAQVEQIKEKYENLLQEHGTNKNTLLSSNAKVSQLAVELQKEQDRCNTQQTLLTNLQQKLEDT